jgi:hypothetical protein
MKYLKLFEEFDAYNEFGLTDPTNIKIAVAELKRKGIKFDASQSPEMTFFIFSSSADLDRATAAVEKVIDKTKEDEWE